MMDNRVKDKNCSVEMQGNGGNCAKNKCPSENCAGCSGSGCHGDGENCTGCSGSGCSGARENGCAGGCPHAVGGAFEWDYDDTVLVFSSDMLEESP